MTLPIWSGGGVCLTVPRLAVQIGHSLVCASLTDHTAPLRDLKGGDVVHLHWHALQHDDESSMHLLHLLPNCAYDVRSIATSQVNEGDFNVRELHLEPKNTRSSAVFRLSNGRLNDLQDVRVGLFEGAAAERAVADALVRAGCVDDERCRVPRCLGRAVVRFPLGELECRSNRVVGLMLEARIMMVVMIMSAPLCLWCDGDENDRDSALLASHLSTLTIANVTLTQLAIGGHWLSLDSLTIANATVDELLLRMSAPLLSQFEWSNVTGTRLPLREIPPQVQLVEIHGATEMLADGILVLPLVRAVRLSVGGTGASSLDLTHCMQLTHLQIANEPHLSSVALSPRVRLAGLALDAVPHLEALGLASALVQRDLSPFSRARQTSPPPSDAAWRWLSAPALPSQSSTVDNPVAEPIVQYPLSWIVTLIIGVVLGAAGLLCFVRSS